MPLPVIICICLTSLAHVADAPLPPVAQATFGVGDTLMIVVIALIVFGPKKLPEISKQLGKLLYEFRKASNDFKFQIEEELRSAEQAERQKQITAQANATPAPVTAAAETPVGEVVSTPETAASPVEQPTDPANGEPAAAPPLASALGTPVDAPKEAPSGPSIQTPASGLPISTRSPYRPVESAPAPSPESPETAQSLDEMEANAQEAVRAAAADPSYSRAADAVPTHHG